jgi:hypothetical protein
MNNAIKSGYTFEIIKGYTFDKAIIFNDYVTQLYKIKESNIKGSSLYLIAKLLMNSLYGKFGMFEILSKHSIISKDELYELNDNENINIEDMMEFDEDSILISFTDFFLAKLN